MIFQKIVSLCDGNRGRLSYCVVTFLEVYGTIGVMFTVKNMDDFWLNRLQYPYPKYWKTVVSYTDKATVTNKNVNILVQKL